MELPYTVKGMDVSFSGILSYIEVDGTVYYLSTQSARRLNNFHPETDSGLQFDDDFILVSVHDPNSFSLYFFHRKFLIRC